ncbi:unnamed protein product [Protopolystoma xenopodis]|uniref:Uncharacterized protein n=1 Tax=Protopolystoma xenopodis TaxID=117903 RepID=A0A448X822_9PLAT|nr:unnamed protein product [Protopolystoma xenopodis]
MTDFVSSSCDSIVTITSQSSEVRNSISSGLDSAVAPTGLELSEVTDAATSFAGDTVVGKGERRNLDSLITQNFENVCHMTFIFV